MDSVGMAGGLIREARLIENYPGLERPLTGPEFIGRLISIISANDVHVKHFHADSIYEEDGIYKISGNGEYIRSRSVIITVGTKPKDFNLPSGGNAIIHRSVLELKQEPPERVLIIGGGEAALDYALNLSDSGSSITILVRGSRLRAAGRLKEQVEIRSEIKILYNTAPVSVFRSGGISHLEAESSGEIIIHETDAVLAAVGREPGLPGFMKDPVYSRGNVRTSIQGMYIAGDASLGSLGQACIAAGQGIQAASYAFEYLKTESGE